MTTNTPIFVQWKVIRNVPLSPLSTKLNLTSVFETTWSYNINYLFMWKRYLVLKKYSYLSQYFSLDMIESFNKNYLLIYSIKILVKRKRIFFFVALCEKLNYCIKSINELYSYGMLIAKYLDLVEILPLIRQFDMITWYEYL